MAREDKPTPAGEEKPTGAAPAPVEKPKNEPSPEIKGKYEVTGVVPGVIIYKGEEIDLRTVTLAKADELHKKGFRFLKKLT